MLGTICLSGTDAVDRPAFEGGSASPLCGRRPATRTEGRHPQGADHQAGNHPCTSAFLCHASVGGWLRYSHHSPLLRLHHPAGSATGVRTAPLNMPPARGAAMRCIASEPVPLLHRIGSSPAMIATLVLVAGRMRSSAPSLTPACPSAPLSLGL